eukprot:760348-Hanusia_phi.AAC.11
MILLAGWKVYLFSESSSFILLLPLLPSRMHQTRNRLGFDPAPTLLDTFLPQPFERNTMANPSHRPPSRQPRTRDFKFVNLSLNDLNTRVNRGPFRSSVT